MEYDVASVRKQFPALTEGAAHFDGPGGSQVPEPVGRAVAGTLTAAVSNRGRRTAAERRADDTVVGARQAMADLLGADPSGVVFGRSMTQLTYDFARTLTKTWQPGDEVVVTRLDHDANIRPWVQAAEAVGALVRWVDFDRDTAELTPEAVAGALSERTRLVAVTAASNLLGSIPAVAEIARHVHDAGALLYVDGVHLTPHTFVDVQQLGADLFACSPYKFLGPHCGVVAGRPELLEQLQPDKLLPSSDVVPERFELGTLPYELLAGTTAAVDFFADLVPADFVPADFVPADLVPAGRSRRERLGAAMAVLEQHEQALCAQIEQRLAGLDAVTLYGQARRRTPTLLFSIAGWESAAVSDALAARGVNAPAGSFYAIEASRWIGLGDTGAVRVGIAPYTDDSDVERLLGGVEEILGR